LVDGWRVRKTCRIQSLAPGLVSVRLRGDAALLGKLGLLPEGAGAAPVTCRAVDWVAVDMGRFRGSVVQGDGLLDLRQAPSLRDGLQTRVRLNGGFFNYRKRADATQGEHVAIGAHLAPGGAALPALPLPAGFEGDYRQLHFADGSSLCSAPTLAQAGVPVFAQQMVGRAGYRLPPDFSFDRGDQITPGVLWHANDPNPRAAISVPVTGEGTVRLVAAPMVDRTDANSGWTLHAFSQMLARVDRLQEPANTSLNLDGGESVALAAWVGGQRVLEVAQTTSPRAVGNYLEFTCNDSGPEACTYRGVCVTLMP